MILRFVGFGVGWLVTFDFAVTRSVVSVTLLISLSAAASEILRSLVDKLVFVLLPQLAMNMTKKM